MCRWCYNSHRRSHLMVCRSSQTTRQYSATMLKNASTPSLSSSSLWGSLRRRWQNDPPCWASRSTRACAGLWTTCKRSRASPLMRLQCSWRQSRSHFTRVGCICADTCMQPRQMQASRLHLGESLRLLLLQVLYTSRCRYYIECRCDRQPRFWYLRGALKSGGA